MPGGEPGQIALKDVLEMVADRPPTVLLFHDGSCCRAAKSWFVSMARSEHDRTGVPPLWIRERWRWGPAEWPIYWCQALESDRLDCGGLAALSRTAIEATGGATLPLQLIELFDSSTLLSWADSWRDAKIVAWIWGEYVYHEAVALLNGPNVTLWDTTTNCWLERKVTPGYAGLAALRIWPRVNADGFIDPPAVNWRGRNLPLGVWHQALAEDGR